MEISEVEQDTLKLRTRHQQLQNQVQAFFPEDANRVVRDEIETKKLNENCLKIGPKGFEDLKTVGPSLAAHGVVRSQYKGLLF